MNKLCVLTIAMLSTAVMAAPVINHSNPSGSDRIRTQSGATCEQAVATGKNFVIGIYGEDQDSSNDYWDGGSNSNRYDGNDFGIYAGINIQFGGEKRINCYRMYNNEMELRALDLKEAQAKHEITLRQLQSENVRLNNLLKNKTHFGE